MVRRRAIPSSGSSEVPEEAALTGAVVELYKARIEPRCKLIQWKVYDLFRSSFSVTEIREKAEQTPGLVISPSDAKRYFSVLLKVEPKGFKGFLDMNDMDLNQQEFDHFQELLVAGGWPLSIAADHQGYEIASWLSKSSRRMGVPSAGFARALLFVRMATQRQLLGTKRGRLVAYVESDEYLRRCNMERMLPTGVEKGEWYVATPKSLLGCLGRLVQEKPDGWLHVSEIKKLIRERFGAELSETAFGCLSLSELLSSDFVANDFELHTVGEGSGDQYLCLRRWWTKRKGSGLSMLQAGMKQLTEVPTAPLDGKLMSILAAAPAPELPSAAVTSPIKVKPALAKLTDTPREGAQTEPCKVEGISIRLDSQAMSSQASLNRAEDRQMVSACRRKGKKSQKELTETPKPSEAAVASATSDLAFGHSSWQELLAVLAPADTQKVSTDRRGKKKGTRDSTEMPQPSAAAAASGTSDLAGDDQDSLPQLPSPADMQKVSRKRWSGKKGQKESTETLKESKAEQAASSSSDRPADPSVCLESQPKSTTQVASDPDDTMDVSPEVFGPSSKVTILIDETVPDTPGVSSAGDPTLQYFKYLTSSRSTPARNRWTRADREPTVLPDEQENGPWLPPPFHLPMYCSIQRTFIQCSAAENLPVRAKSSPCSPTPERPEEMDTEVTEDV